MGANYYRILSPLGCPSFWVYPMCKLKMMLNKKTIVAGISIGLVVLLSLVFILPNPSHANLNLELPDLEDLDNVNNSNAGTTQAVGQYDNHVGLSIVRKMRQQLPIIEDPELSQWLIAMGQRLSRSAGVGGKLYFVLVDNPEVNAAAYDGGVVLVNSGLVLYTTSESELAAVVAHEIAHITQNHLARRRADASGSGNILATGAAVLAGLAVGAQDSQAGGALITSALALQAHQQLAFNRSMEAEADRIGIRTLVRAGYKAAGMPSLQEKLDRLNDNPNAELFKYIRSHPLSIERVSNTRNLARNLGNQGRESIDYVYAREKMRALTRRVGKTVTPPLPNATVQNYAKAMNLYYQGRINDSYTLLQNQQQQRASLIALATVLNDKRDYQQTVNLLSNQVNVRPSDIALLIPLSNALLGLGRAKEAWQRIARIIPSEQTSLRFFELKQEIARQAGYQADAYIAAAERNVRIGEYRYAILQLQQAQQLPNLTGNERAKVSARLNQIKSRYGEKKK